MTSRPPPGMASRALTARFTSTCSSWLGSASTGGRPSSTDTLRVTSSPSVRSSSDVMSSSTSRRSSTRLCTTSRRLNTSSWFVSLDGALGGARHLLGVRAQRAVGGQPVDDEAGVAADDREEVVEVVRDAAGELAHALEALGLAQLSLEALALGHVAAVQHDALQVGVVELARGDRLHGQPAALARRACATRAERQTRPADAASASEASAACRSSGWIRSATVAPSPSVHRAFHGRRDVEDRARRRRPP